MSAEFSRRSFLKYTALAAVAVAGSNLLTGCSETNPVQTAVGTTNTVLKVKVTLDSAVYDPQAGTLTFELTLINGRENALQVTRENFAVSMPDGSYYANMNSLIRVYNISEDPGLQVKKNATQKYRIITSAFPGFEAGAVRLSYQPDFTYDEYTANWLLGKAEFTESDSTAIAAYAMPGLEV